MARGHAAADRFVAHVDRIEKNLKTLMKTVPDVLRVDHLEEMLVLIRHPGFTTPAELAVVQGLLETTQALVHQIGRLNETLLAGSRQIVESA